MLQIPLNQLKPAKNNVRQVKASKESLAHLKASIESQGLLHNLVVMKNGAGYHVIDGNRRLQALYAITAKHHQKRLTAFQLQKTIRRLVFMQT